MFRPPFSNIFSNLVSTISGITYILYDQFTTDRAAGAVNGTAADVGGTRKVVDTNSKLSISSSRLSFATGGSVLGNPGLWYSSLTRASGKILIGSITQSDGSAVPGYFGFDTDQSSYPLENSFMVSNFNGITYINPMSGGSTGPSLAIYSGLTCQYAVILRSSGAYYFIKGGTFTNWTFLWSSTTPSTSTLYPAIVGDTTVVQTADNIRIPTSTWLPTSLAYDTFTRADGAIGNSETTGPDGQTTPALAWTGGAISTNKNVITPSLGSEIALTPDFEGTYVAGLSPNWMLYGTPTAAEENTIKHGGSASQKVTTTALSNGVSQAVAKTTGQWYQTSAWLYVTAGSAQFYIGSGSPTVTATSTWTQVFDNFRALNSSGTNLHTEARTASSTYYVDDMSYKPLTLSSLFSSVSTSDADVIADANVTLTAGTQAGLVTNLDSTSSPANLLIAYHDGTNMHLDKCVAGVYTSLINTAAAYAGGNKVLRVITYHSDANTLKVRVYWNNALVGAEQTVTNGGTNGIIGNTKHGLFSTLNTNTFDNFCIWARGSDNEYYELDLY